MQVRLLFLRTAVCGVALLVASSVGIVASTPSRASANEIPKACTLLTHEEAEKLADADLAGAKLDAAQQVTDDFCEWDNPPGGYTAQVEIFIGESAKKTLDLERKNVVPVPGLGDEAYEEEGYIFARKGSVWIEIHLVRLAEWDPFWQAMRDAARIALSRVPAGASETPKISVPPKVVSRIPPGGGSNPLWPGKQKRFGGNLDKLGDVVYQPNVVLIGGGANAIRGISPDGLTWTIAGNSAGAAKLKVGTIMAATTLALGRVLAIKRVGPDLKVTIGPVALTDVFRKATFEGKGAALKQPLYYNTALPAGPAKAMRMPQTSSQLPAGGTLTTSLPKCCANVGVDLAYNHPAGRMAGSIHLSIPKPSVDFRIVIENGLKEASLRINSTAALKYRVEAATTSVKGNFNMPNQRLLDGSITIPLGSGLALTFTQSLRVSLALAGAARYESSAEFTLKGNLGFSYKNGKTNADAATLVTGKSALDFTSSAGLGPSRIILVWSLRATLGVGLAGLTAGAWYEIHPALDVTHNGLPESGLYRNCVIAGFGAESGWGVGYTVPSFALSIFNAILKHLGAKPIEPTGGPRLGTATLYPTKTAAKCPPGVTPPPTG